MLQEENTAEECFYDTMPASKLRLKISVARPVADRICKIGVFGESWCDRMDVEEDYDWTSQTVTLEQPDALTPYAVGTLQLPTIYE